MAKVTTKKSQKSPKTKQTKQKPSSPKQKKKAGAKVNKKKPAPKTPGTKAKRQADGNVHKDSAKRSKNAPKRQEKQKKKARKTVSEKSPSVTNKKAITPRSKRARHRRAAMTANDSALTRAETAIMERMAQLKPEDPRYGVLESALAFKASWVILGEHLNKVHNYTLFKEWGFGSFARYCTDEIRITTTTARKLVKSFQWLGEEAPELIPVTEGGRPHAVTREVPDFNAIGVLADARKELHNDRVPEDAYLQLKRAALEGDRTASQLRKELKDAIPEALRQQTVDPVRSLRRALNASVRCLEALREWDGSDELLLQAEQLRDQIAHHVPRRSDGTQSGATSSDVNVQ